MATKGIGRDRLSDLLAANPKADGATVREGLRLVDQLREAGVAEHVYDLASPYGRATHSADDGVWNMAGVR